MSNQIRPNRLKEIAARKGVTPLALVTDALATAGSVNGAANLLGVARNTIRYWMKKNGLTSITTRVSTIELRSELEAV